MVRLAELLLIAYILRPIEGFPPISAVNGSICEAAGGKLGQCVGVPEFPQYLATWKKRPHSREAKQFLEQHYCGKLPDGRALVCRPVQLNEPECGLQLTDRIVKGNVTDLDQYPWMALFKYSKPYGAVGYDCGGSLINRRFVLSAAHCFVGLRRGWQPIAVRLGEWDFEADPDCIEDVCADPVQEFGLEKIFVHERFSIKNFDRQFDIALVKIAGEAEYNSYVRSICLPEPGVVDSKRFYGGIQFASGWGKTENATYSRYKLYTKLDVANYQNCKTAYARDKRINLADHQYCTIGRQGQDTCNGDSGGPIMKEIIEQGRHFVIGVVSFGPSRCGQQLPGVNTKVESFYRWIVEKVVQSS